MAHYRPETSLLNHIFIPFQVSPVEFEQNSSFFTLESNELGIPSIISLTTIEGNNYIPYIDLSKFDGEREQWYWEDAYGLFFKMIPDGDLEFRSSIYNGSEILQGVSVSYTHDLVGRTYSYDDTKKKDKLSYTFNNEVLSFWQFAPIIITMEGVRLIDRTNYASSSAPVLTEVNTTENREFYYSFRQNKIITNQNLAGVRPEDIKIKFYTVPNEVSFKCRMAANNGATPFYTPTVDWYIAKLNGQSFRG